MSVNKNAAIDNLFNSPLPFHERAEELCYLNGTEEFRNLVETTYDIKVSKVWLMGWGYSNLNFLLTTGKGKYLVRVSVNNKKEADLRFEAVIKEQLHSRGIPVRRIISSIKGELFIKSPLGRVMQAFTYLEGSIPKKYSLEHVRGSGKLLSNFHLASQDFFDLLDVDYRNISLTDELKLVLSTLKSSWISRHTKNLLPRRVISKRGLVMNKIESLCSLLESSSFTFNTSDFIHNDYTPHNVIFRNNKAYGVIDFELAGFADLRWDISNAVAQWSIHAHNLSPLSILKNFTSGYTNSLVDTNQQIIKKLSILAILKRVSASFNFYDKYSDKSHWQDQVSYFLSRMELLCRS